MLRVYQVLVLQDQHISSLLKVIRNIHFCLALGTFELVLLAMDSYTDYHRHPNGEHGNTLASVHVNDVNHLN